jgi:sugar phosphate isomerase/epimerase
MLDRRTFLGATAAALVTGCMRSGASSGATMSSSTPGSARLPLSFSTLGCPKWSWQQVLSFASANGYAAIELRGIQDTIDLWKLPEFQPGRVSETRREIAGRGLSIAGLGASTNLHEMEPAKHASELAQARTFIDLASLLGTPYVRVFGNKYVAGVPREAMIAHVAAGLRTLGDYAREKNVVVLLESHGDFVDSPTLLELMQRADSPAVAMLWDAHHTFVLGKESPETTVRHLGRYIRHVHLKDSIPAEKDRRYVLTGTGEVPIRRQVEALARMGYRGYYSFEWEKRWHPEIEEPEVAFAQFAAVASGYLRDAGVGPRG